MVKKRFNQHYQRKHDTENLTLHIQILRLLVFHEIFLNTSSITTRNKLEEILNLNKSLCNSKINFQSTADLYLSVLAFKLFSQSQPAPSFLSVLVSTPSLSLIMSFNLYLTQPLDCKLLANVRSLVYSVSNKALYLKSHHTILRTIKYIIVKNLNSLYII